MGCSIETVRSDVAGSLRELIDRDTGRLAGLDGLRALAVSAVLALHFGYAPGGSLGVAVFFVLSGQLITALLLKEFARTGGIDFAAFSGRRLARLLPALLAMLLPMSAYELYRAGTWDTASIRALPSVIGYWSNWALVRNGPGSIGYWDHTWSLAVEMQFYLAWPLVLVLALRLGPRWPVGVALACAIASAAWRGWLFASGAPPHRVFGTDLAVDQLMTGALLAMAAGSPVWPRVAALAGIAWPAALLALAALSLGALGDASPALTMPVVTLCAGVMVAALVQGGGVLDRALSWPPLVAIGRLSYAIYLWHFPLIWAASGHVHGRLALAAAVTSLSVLAALASWVFVERPFQRMIARRRVKPSRVPAEA